ncbi:MAG TPA: TolC family protein [Oligoflexia bacterium]|nr:TolC family protein [Oligoflexia bacterium]HMP48928.1 TolC family protein [Oligoflexia bacterium]
MVAKSFFLSVAAFLIVVLILPAYANEKSNKVTPTSNHKTVLTPGLVLENILENHPLISAAKENIEGQKGSFLASKGAFDRVMKGEYRSYVFGKYSGDYADASIEQPFELFGSRLIAGARRGTGSFPIYDNYFETNNTGEIRTGLEVPILRNRSIDQRRAEIRKADIGQRVADLNLRLTKINLLRNGGSTFWEWVAAHQKLAVFEELLSVAQDRNNQFKKRTEAGDLAQFDQTDNERQVLQRETQLLEAKRKLVNAEYNLSLFYRDEYGIPRDIGMMKPANNLVEVKEIITDSPNKEITKAHEMRPDLQNLSLLREQVKADLEVAENNLLPQIDLQSYLARDLGAESTRRSDAEVNVGFKVEVPIQTRSQDGRIAALSARMKEIDAVINNLKDRIRVEVTDSINAIQIAKDRVVVAKKEHALAAELEKGERIKFVQGDSNLIFVNLREQTTSDAAVREIDSILAYRIALTDYYAALGHEITEDELR